MRQQENGLFSVLCPVVPICRIVNVAILVSTAALSMNLYEDWLLSHLQDDWKQQRNPSSLALWQIAGTTMMGLALSSWGRRFRAPFLTPELGY